MNTEIYKKVHNVRLSGSTCTSVFIYGQKVYCANVGNSRTILIRFDKNEDGCVTGALSADPGLAMTSSFGDATAARVGVTAIPEIIEHELTPDDKVLVLASDGVW